MRVGIPLKNGMTTDQTMCRRCGTCCRQGGPALHLEDLDLVKSGRLQVSSLLTIRKGELAHNPLAGRIQPVRVELVKIAGTGRQWTCGYHDAELGCTIYENRPLACRVLKCWDTAEILELVERDTLSRLDILDQDHPLVPLIREHERICPCEDLGDIQKNFARLSAARKTDMEKRVGLDLNFRTRVIADFQLKVNEELFYFGRPLFQLLQPLGVRISESTAGFHLDWTR